MATSKGRILCTDDNEDTRQLLILILTQSGYDVTCTDDPNKVVELIKTKVFDLCLMDNWMPGLSGEDLCKRIREFDTETPILFYSGAAFDADKKRAREAGAQGYLVKPVLEDELTAEVERVITASKTGVRFAPMLANQG